MVDSSGTAEAPEDLVARLLFAGAERRGVPFVFLGEDGEVVDERSLHDLRANASHVATLLDRSGVRAGQRVLLLYPPGLAFVDAFLGCLYRGVVAVPAPIPHPERVERGLARVKSIVSSAGPVAALTTAAARSTVNALLALVPGSTVGSIVTDGEIISTDPSPPAPRSGSEIALLQYTSGSTSVPRAAALSRDNLTSNLRFFDDGWEHDEGTVVTWLPTFHDLGLVYGVLLPLYCGIPAVMLSPLTVMKRPIRWLEAMSRFRGTHSMGPNFVYELCLRRASVEQCAGLDLSHCRVLLNAAEPVRADTLRRFHRRFERCGLRWSALSPGYGLSEGTCKVTTFPAGHGPTILHVDGEALSNHRVERADAGSPHAKEVVGCGIVCPPTRVEIVDWERDPPVSTQHVGEIWISGPGVIEGYWRGDGSPLDGDRPEQGRLPDDATRFLRTGDLGFVRDGVLYVTGRLKDLVIVNGQNHYPQDIESTAESSHAALRPGCSAAFSVDGEYSERLVLVAELNPNRDDDEAIRSTVRAAVFAGHDLPISDVVLVEPGAIPKTSSGKIQRRLTRQLYLSSTWSRVHGGSA